MKPNSRKKYSTTFSAGTLDKFKRACRLRGVPSNSVLERAMEEFITETQSIFKGKEVEVLL